MRPRHLWLVHPNLDRGLGVRLLMLGDACSSRNRPGMNCCTTFTTHHRVSSRAHWHRRKASHSNWLVTRSHADEAPYSQRWRI